MSIARKCIVDGCDKYQYRRQYCSVHYQRLMKSGRIHSTISVDGHSKHELYRTYSRMKERCYNKNHQAYNRYGGRGIKVCDRWLGKLGFHNFLEDMGERHKHATLDRIDNNGDYTPDNCRWANIITQSRNRNSAEGSSSLVRGVSFNKRRNKWRVNIMADNNVYIQIGEYKTEAEAIKARKEAELKYWA